VSHFGNRVIGKEKAEEEAAVEKTRANHFGPRVIGDILQKRRLEARQDEGAQAPDSRSDPGVKQAKREEAAEKRAETEAEIETIQAPTSTNLEELGAALEGNPAFYEQLYSAEFARASGPRKSALRLFLVFEMEHEDREDRKSDIEKALNPKG
jgi:hypothetical protein